MLYLFLELAVQPCDPALHDYTSEENETIYHPFTVLSEEMKIKLSILSIFLKKFTVPYDFSNIFFHTYLVQTVSNTTKKGIAHEANIVV